MDYTERMQKAQEWIGKHVVFIDPLRKQRDALITAVHNVDEDGRPTYINLVVVSDDPAAHDQYGRQTDKQFTSVPMKSDMTGAGRYFQFLGDLVVTSQ